jgi:hypothetical protein
MSQGAEQVSQPVTPPKITTFNPMRVAVETDGGNVTLVCFLPMEVVTVVISADAWKTLNEDVERAMTGIIVAKNQLIVPR